MRSVSLTETLKKNDFKFIFWAALHGMADLKFPILGLNPTHAPSTGNSES